MVRKGKQRSFVCSVTVIVALSMAVAAFSAPAMAASVSGEITVAGGKKLKNMVIYLEPADEKAAEAVKNYRVTQKGRVFNPSVMVVVAGSSVIFVNDEDQEIDHNVYSLSRTRKFDVGLASVGSELVVDFPEPGTVKYYCSVHKFMEGTIVVVPSPFYMLMEEPGTFTLKNVPEGAWKLNAAISHRRYAAEPVDVSVSDGSVDSVSLEISRKRKKKATE